MLKTQDGEIVGTARGPLTLTIDEVARALGINRGSAYQAAAIGEIPTIRIGRRLLIPKVAFERMLESAGQKRDGSPESA
jgi:excisionase family DNA binding protein